MTDLVFSPGYEINQYIREISKFPVLSPSEEIELASKLETIGCRDSARKMVLSHLRLVVKIAMGYRSYGIAVLDLISEGNIGLMHAVAKFRLNMGCRLATYASWWIKSHIQDFILKSWSLVKVNGNKLKEHLFCRQKKVDEALESYNQPGMLESSLRYNISLDRGGEEALNHSFSEILADDEPHRDEVLIQSEETARQQAILRISISQLNDRERDIVVLRHMKKEPETLSSLAQKYGISSERVRQIEEKAMTKLRHTATKLAALPLKKLEIAQIAAMQDKSSALPYRPATPGSKTQIQPAIIADISPPMLTG